MGSVRARLFTLNEVNGSRAEKPLLRRPGLQSRRKAAKTNGL